MLNLPDGFNTSPGANKGGVEEDTDMDVIDSVKLPADSEASICMILKKIVLKKIFFLDVLFYLFPVILIHNVGTLPAFSS